MAIDASIYSQLQAPKFESPLNALAQVTQVRNSQNQNRLFDMKVAESERTLAGENALNDAYRGATGADGTIDRNKLFQSIASGGQGAKLPGIQKGLADTDKSTFDAQKSQLDAAGKNAEIVGQYMTAAKQNPALYPQILAQLRAMIPGGGKDLPDQFDPSVVDATITRAMSVKDQIAAKQKELDYQLDQQKFGETVRNNKTQNGIAAGNLGVAQAGLGLRKQELDQKKTMDKETIKQNAATNAKVNDAKDVLGLLDEVDALLPTATNGLLGVGYDKAAGAFGGSTDGANATAQLKALQGSLVSKMPKMTGPQSDKDVQLYREMAGQVGDPLVPRAQRQAASKTIRKLNEKYAGMEEGSSIKGNASKIDSLLDKYK